MAEIGLKLNYEPLTDFRELFENLQYETHYKMEGKKRIYYKEILIAFDIETSSFIYNGEKMATMYCWQLGVNGKAYIGRTWEDFFNVYNYMRKTLKINFYNRVIVWVHNLPYEFQFIRQLFNWVSIFARDERKPMKALTAGGVEFRCSYILSGVSLEKIANDLVYFKIRKLKDIFDYDKIRHYKTELTDNEKSYCVNDVLILNCYIWEQINIYGKITKIPMTNTGRVRTKMREVVFEDKKAKKLIQSLKVTSEEELKALEAAFQGGFTHANYQNIDISTGLGIYNVKSKDFTSSYPTVMICEKYPMTTGEKIKISYSEMQENRKEYCYICEVKIVNLKEKLHHENPLSFSKCSVTKNAKVNNGRVMTADEIITTTTDVDLFEILAKFYEWDDIKIGNCWRYHLYYLPTPIISTILELYKTKTEYKDIEEKIVDYMIAKGMLNSTYGMMVMSINQDEVTFTREDGWNTKQTELISGIAKYNEDNNRFTFYPWGVFITAYARRNLFMAIEYLENDYLYSDTDSVKYKNPDNHDDFFEDYNEKIKRKIKKALYINGFDTSLMSPKTKDGVEKPLGVFDDDGHFERFKTLGAKRYMTQDKKGKIKMTVAGVSKRGIAEYLKMKAENEEVDIFTLFEDELVVPEEYSGRLVSSYIDEETRAYIADYKGAYCEVCEKSSIHLGKSEYNMNIPDEYLKLLTDASFDYKL